MYYKDRVSGPPETKFVQLGSQIGLSEENRIVGVWDQVFEDKKGLYVSGRILEEVRAGAEALALLRAGAIDGLSIGYRTVKASKAQDGGRSLKQLDLWEVSLVTFPMLPEARVQSSVSDDDDGALARALADVFSSASSMLTRE